MPTPTSSTNMRTRSLLIRRIDQTSNSSVWSAPPGKKPKSYQRRMGSLLTKTSSKTPSIPIATGSMHGRYVRNAAQQGCKWRHENIAVSPVTMYGASTRPVPALYDATPSKNTPGSEGAFHRGDDYLSSFLVRREMRPPFAPAIRASSGFAAKPPVRPFLPPFAPIFA